MEKSQSTKQENKQKKQQEGYKIQPGQEDLFKMSLEKAFGRKVSDQEAKEMDEILSGVSSEGRY